jgi:hypothetical protein
VIRAAGSGDGCRPDWPTRSTLTPNLSAVSPHKVALKASIRAPGPPDRADAERRIAFHPGATSRSGGRPMSIYASVVALWFMAVALFLIGALIRAWFVALGHRFGHRRNGLNSSKADAHDATRRLVRLKTHGRPAPIRTTNAEVGFRCAFGPDCSGKAVGAGAEAPRGHFLARCAI